ncbi:MAG TPA: TonB-dependent siderophore receptor [Burkholderiaceae bacterium]|nr:TonB-dependent siderophore receptor [Burkholderiaceae bacterium]
MPAAIGLMALMAGGAAAQTSPEPAPTDPAPMLPAVRAKATAEPSGKEALRATTTSIGKGRQELRDIPQSVTVVTEKLIDDRNVDTLKDALKQTAGIAFQAAEGGEEDIRLRGFSLQASGDIFIDGMRDPAFYERDTFNWDRLELLRGSASMLFGRGSTGGAVNQVSKQPFAMTQHELSFTLGSGDYLRAVGDFNLHTGEDAALRVNAMVTSAQSFGARIDKRGVAPSYRWGIGTRNEFQVGAFALRNDNGIHYGLPWLTPGASGGDWLWPTDPDNTYGMASDVARSGTTQAHASHIHRFEGGRELKTQVRVAEYTRDQRASAVRFVAAAQQPDGLAVTSDTFSDATLLQRSNGTGVQLKTMNMDTVYAQSDYSGRHKWLGLDHSVQTGVDLAHEKFENFGLASTSPTLAKPRTTVGSPDDGAWIDESQRALMRNRTFTAKGLGAYVQDLVQIAPMWKLLAGLRWDKLDGSYRNLATTAPGNNVCAVAPLATIERSDSLWSRRFGVLFQPDELQSYHLSYGTSFNTSGDTYQYDAGTANTAPEKSRNVELGAKIDSASGRFTTRFALFHSTKYNERNRDAESVDACNYVLSGKRHAAGLELDLTGRITKDWEIYGSYAYIPSARVDESSGAAGTEVVGSRPGLTPRHSGTVWTTYQITPRWRVGGGMNARSSDRPVGLAAGSAIVAPKFVTADLMAEYTLQELSYKLSLTNVTDEHYADFLYRGHYIPGKGRAVQMTMAYKF